MKSKSDRGRQADRERGGKREGREKRDMEREETKRTPGARDSVWVSREGAKPQALGHL